MEDKLPSNESHVSTLRHFIERHKVWDQRDEVRLAEYLQQLSNKITQGAKSTLNELDDLVASIDDTAVQISNINNEFQLLADKQFIENKVQEEDETVQIKVEKPVARETNNNDTLVNNLKEALKNSFNAIDSHFEKVTVEVSDSDEDDDELKHETILRPRTFYKKLNLPSLSGNRQSEIDINSAMSSDSDSVVEQPNNEFKDEESLSSNDIPEEDINSVIESKIHEPITQSIETHSNTFVPEIRIPDNNDDDLFIPPPLLNDYEEENLENDYNIFDNSSNMYGERTLWDDDDDDSSNEPPLPIHLDEPPQPVIKSNIQTNAEVPSIQESLNAELRKRFHKDDNISSISDNINVEPSKIKLPKGAVNILGGTDIKPYAANPDQNKKQAIVSQISKSVSETVKNKSIEDVNNSNKLLNKPINSTVTSGSKDIKKEIQPKGKRSLFQQDSDDENLFVEKKTIATIASRPKENLAINIKSPRNIFSDSDSDDEFINSKSITKPVISHTDDNHSTKLLDSSSEDDLFNVKSLNNKSVLKQKNTLFSSSVHDKISDQTKQVNNEIKQKLESSIQEKNAQQILNKKTVDKLMESNSKKSNILAENAVISKESSPNINVLNKNITEPMKNSIKSLNSQHKKNFSKFFSSDEDDLDDDVLLNVNKTNESKVKIFDSSSDDDIFNKPTNNLISSKIIKPSDSEEIKTMGSKLNDKSAIINQPQITGNLDKTNSTENKNKNMFSNLSDDEDDHFFSFNSSSDRSFNISNIHNLEENSKAMSLSSEEFLSPQTDLKNKNISSENLLTSQNHKLIDKEEIAIPANETLNTSKEDSIRKNKLDILSSSDDEQQVPFNSSIHNENSQRETKEIPQTLNSSFENIFDYKNLDTFNAKNLDKTNNDTLFTSNKNTSSNNQSFVFSSSEDEEQVSFDSYTHTKKTEEIHHTSNLSFENVLDNKNQNMFNEKNIDKTSNEILPIFKEDSIQKNRLSILLSSEDEDQISSNLYAYNKNTEKETKEIRHTSNSSSENVFDNKNQNIYNEKNIDKTSNEILPIFKEDSIQKNRLSILLSSEDEDQISSNLYAYNKNTEKETKEIRHTSNSSSENVFGNKNQNIYNEKNIDKTSNEILPIFKEDSIQKNKLSILLSSEDEDQISSNLYAYNKNSEKETKEIRHTSNSSYENILDNQKNPSIFNEKNKSTSNNDTLFTSTENLSQTNQLSIPSNSDDDEDLEINNKDKKKKTKFIESKTDSKESLNDTTDGSSFSTPNSRDEPKKKLPGKLNKNAGAFINIAGLLPNSKKPLNMSAIPKSASLDEKSDECLPTIETKLYSAGKERAKIQVKRRPQSRKARIAAARMSSIDIGHESNFQETSRLFSSTSDLVDHESSPILNATDFSNELQYKIPESFDTKLVTNDDTIDEGSEQQIITNNKVKKQAALNLSDFDSNSFESSQTETKITNEYKDKKEQIFHEELSESKFIYKEQRENEFPLDKQVKAIAEDQTVKEVIENESTTTQNIKLSKKSNSLFDDNDDLFSSKTEKVKKKTSSLFDSDNELEFGQKFTNKTVLKNNSIFGDDSDDDDLFNSTNKLSASNLPIEKPIDNLSRQKIRSSSDGYVKLTAESVAINPLESKET